VTWNEQVRGLKRQLSAKTKYARARLKRRAREVRETKVKAEPVIVHGTVDQAFLDRMRRKGVRVEVKP
jgi:hypothetical protein